MLIERIKTDSGAKRRTEGQRLRNITFSASHNFFLIDFAIMRHQTSLVVLSTYAIGNWFPLHETYYAVAVVSEGRHNTNEI